MAAEDAKDREIEKEKGRVYSEELREQIAGNMKRRGKELAAEQAQDRKDRDCYKEWWIKTCSLDGPILILYLMISTSKHEYIKMFIFPRGSEIYEERQKKFNEPHGGGDSQTGVFFKNEDRPVIEKADIKEEISQLESVAISNSPTKFTKCNVQCQVLKKF